MVGVWGPWTVEKLVIAVVDVKVEQKEISAAAVSVSKKAFPRVERTVDASATLWVDSLECAVVA